jgi:hypothetical protein
MAKFELRWTAPEFEYREKDVSWYWTSIIIAAVIIAFAVWQKNFLFGFFIVVAEMLFIVWGSRVPREMDFVLSDEELRIGAEKSHSIKEFESWSVDKDDEWADFHFYFRSRVKAPLRVIAPTARLDEIRAQLKTVLREVEHELTLVDSIEKFLRF